MTPSPDIITDFSALQKTCNELGKSNVHFAQENAKLREVASNLASSLRPLAWLAGWENPNTAESALAGYDSYLSNTQDDPPRSGG
jgi:hypothetical protein